MVAVAVSAAGSKCGHKGSEAGKTRVWFGKTRMSCKFSQSLQPHECQLKFMVLFSKLAELQLHLAYI